MLKELERKEIILIDEFTAHPILAQCSTMDWDTFLSVLIQRRFLSKSVINLYEEAIDLLTDERSKQIIRLLIKEEFPRCANKAQPLPSHRELLWQDLVNMGATSQQIGQSLPSTMTKHTIDSCLNILSQDFGKPNFELGIITALRFMTEVLVAVEYECFWSKIQQKLSSTLNDDKPRSEFYYFHMIHDRRGKGFIERRLTGGENHSEALAKQMVQFIKSSHQVDYCVEIEQQVFEIKYNFYHQFL
jgi:hypothetical protein